MSSAPPLLLAVAALAAACAPAPATTPVVTLPPPPASTATAPEKPPASPQEDPLQIKDGIPYFQGKVLHPGALNELLTTMADHRPIDVAVDLQGVQESNKYYRGLKVRERFVDYYDDDVMGKGGSLSYVFLGVTPGKIYAFETYSSGGGTMISMHVLLVRIDKDAERRDEKMETRWVMKRVGDVTVGDRSDGKVTLTGSTLTLSASRYLPKEVSIKLE